MSDTEEKTKYFAQLFIGFPMTSSLWQKLQKSIPFKTSRVSLSKEDLVTSRHDNRDYLGIYLKNDKMTYKTIQQTEERLKNMLLNYLPNISTHDLHIEIFSKLFVV